MPRPKIDNPSPETLRSRERYRREKEGLVLVQIGGDRFEVSAEKAEKLRREAEKAQS